MVTNSGGNDPALKRAAAAMAALCTLLLVSGCAEQRATSESEPTITTLSESMTTEPSSPSAEASSWMDRFDADQLEKYEAALTRWQEYSRKTEAIYREGLDTPEAREVFREYDLQAVARIRSLAETYEAQGLRTVRGPESLSTEAISIDGSVVRLSQCNDYSRVLVTRNGKRVPGLKPQNPVTPLLIEMDRVAGGDWMVARVQLKDRTSCAG